MFDKRCSARLVQNAAALKKDGVFKPTPILCLAALLTASADAQDPAKNHPRMTRAQKPAATRTAPSSISHPALPPLPSGVEELKFSEFFKTPVGPKGLELTDRVNSLDGKRVRILGFMVIEAVGQCNANPQPVMRGRRAASWFEASVPGRMLLCPTGQTVNFAHYGLCDTLPPQTLFVTVPEFFGEPVPYTPGPMLLTGRLEVGQKTEADGRISTVRLLLEDPVTDSPTTRTANQANP